MSSIIKNADALATTELRRDALAIAEAGYAAVDVGAAMARKLHIEGDALRIGDSSFSLHERRVFFVGVGKCAIAAAEAVEKLLGERLTGGIALDVRGQGERQGLQKIQVFAGTHPKPTSANLEAAKHIVELLEGCTEQDLVLLLVSGGGSTLLCLHDAPMTCLDEGILFDALTGKGATIQELNVVRKHISYARGGGLAKVAYPAEVVSLIISDVPGNDLASVASGPTILDKTTIADAEAVLARYGIPLPPGGLLETPKDEKYFARVTNLLFLTNRDALEAMQGEALSRGYHAEIVSDDVQGEAREVAQAVVVRLHGASGKSALLYAGETTVTLAGEHGEGGRNQEVALAALEQVGEGELVLPFASDGRDASDAAGAIADLVAKRHAAAQGLSIEEDLARHASYTFFTRTGDALETGLLESNVSDLLVALTNSPMLMEPTVNNTDARILWFEDISLDDVPQVGGKNASLGEMIRALEPKGVRIPHGFAVTAAAYYHYLKETKLDAFIEQTLKGLDTKNLKELSRCGALIRDKMRATPLPADLENEIAEAYARMEEEYGAKTDVAVRSSATAEDLPGASFAGEQETYLNIRGAKDVIRAAVWTMASLFTDRAISYRADRGFDHMKVALSVGVQKMVRSDKGASGVMFTVDTESGFRDVVLINAVWGLGEMIVQGHVTPDEYLVMKSKLGIAKQPIITKKIGTKKKKMIYGTGKGVKQTKIISTTRTEEMSFVLTDKEIETMAGWGKTIEEHYSERAKKWTPMDMEWAKDGITGQLYIVQARPETVQAGRDFSKLVEYEVSGQGRELIRGISVGSKVATGKVHVILSPKQIREFKAGEILVTTMTDPDWEPVMKMASAIVTDKGGRTSHAAIVSRELGLPAIVGSGNATKVLKNGTEITIDTTGSAGVATLGRAKVEKREHDAGAIPETRTHVMVNIASPEIAFEESFLPVKGVGLAREEFIIASQIGVHPLAILNFKKQSPKIRAAIQKRMQGWSDPVAYYVDNLAFGIAKIAAAFAPRPVIVRFSDFKTNEYATLLGGEAYEPKENNPMIGWRGASRYYDERFKDAFALECQALSRVRTEMGLDNVIPMIPFCRTTKEADAVLAIMAAHGLVAKSLAQEGQTPTPVYMMCEIPSNVVRVNDFLDRFDGLSIGSNDLTQLTLGLDRDSGDIASIGNENDDAVRSLIRDVIRACRVRGKYLGICGQGPSDLPDFAEFLVREGIESMSLNPDAVVKTIEKVAAIEVSLAQQ